MAEGLNVARLHYDYHERWWKMGERQAHSAEELPASACLWDGCLVAFEGPILQLEFRLKGRREAAILVHEAEADYAAQRQRAHAATNLTRLLMNLYVDAKVRYCAFPVASPWLADEDWRSLLQPPYYPDFFLLPASTAEKFPRPFRTVHLFDDRIMVTTLPVKFSPDDDVPEPSDRDRKLDSLRKCHALGEKYYDQLYETNMGTSGPYSSAKDAFIDAISTANQLGLKEQAKLLEDRLDHIKAVFRSQFT